MFFHRPVLFPSRAFGLQFFGVDDKLFSRIQKAVTSSSRSDRRLHSLIADCRAAQHSLAQKRRAADAVLGQGIDNLPAYLKALDNVEDALAECIKAIEARLNLPF